MDNFIDRLLSKDDGRMSEIALNTKKSDHNCMMSSKEKNCSHKRNLSTKRNQDSIDKNFYSVEGMSYRNEKSINDENAW